MLHWYTMANVPISEQTKAEVVYAVKVSGMSLRAAAAKYGVSAPSVKRWIAELEAEVAAEPAPGISPVSHPPAPTEPAPDPDLLSEDPLICTRAMRRDFLRSAAVARGLGNTEAAARLNGHAGKMAIVEARLASAAKESGDGVTYNRAELDAAVEGVKEKVAALLARPLCCARCGRELAADLAGLAKDAQARLFDHGDITPDPKKV